MGATNFFTKTLSDGSLTISASDNVTKISVICRQGSISYQGNVNFQGNPSEAMIIEENQGLTLTASATSNPIDGVTIISASGTDIAEIILSTS